MTDEYLMDSHKMMWHPRRVADWLDGKPIAPIHIDAGLSKGCNIKCHYCIGALQGNLYKRSKEYFPREPLLRYMRDAGKIGVKSIAIIGEAEPTLNPHMYDAIIEGNKAGVDISVGTNGILYDTGEKGIEALKNLKWIRFNISAASDESYRRLHGSKEFDKVMEKIKFCVDIKKEYKLNLDIGLQMVLTPDDVNEVIPLAKLGKKLNVDYLVVKQCSDDTDNFLGIYDKFDLYDGYTKIFDEAEAENSDDYNVIVKRQKIARKAYRDYTICYGTPFLLYTSGDGKVFPCGLMFEEEFWDEYMMGDLTKDSFIDIIHSDRYKEVIDKMIKKGLKNCYTGCRTNEINSYLWKLKHPPKHRNFI
jgi:MoaA/NifB/PqqE/SkfB family radical SAM enzyme